MTETQPEDKLWVAIYENKAFVRPSNRGSFKISTALKQFGISAIEQGCTLLIFDMTTCIGMDSTFMGVLAGLAFKLRDRGQIIMINLNTKTKGLLGTLGLDKIIQSYLCGDTSNEIQEYQQLANTMSTLDASDTSRREIAETMLEAHENLVELSADNLPKFKDVLTFLHEDVQKMREKEKQSDS